MCVGGGGKLANISGGGVNWQSRHNINTEFPSIQQAKKVELPMTGSKAKSVCSQGENK